MNGMIAQVADTLNRLDMVEWDRYVGDDDALFVYGWIVRGDGHRDFIVMWWIVADGAVVDPETPGWVSSSVEHSAALSEAIYGDAVAHIDCRDLGPHHEVERVAPWQRPDGTASGI